MTFVLFLGGACGAIFFGLWMQNFYAGASAFWVLWMGSVMYLHRRDCVT